MKSIIHPTDNNMRSQYITVIVWVIAFLDIINLTNYKTMSNHYQNLFDIDKWRVWLPTVWLKKTKNVLFLIVHLMNRTGNV